ncbi:lytic polysaccharide monooxygenase [Fulvivirga maritima]|uniref:lytic polysaccharide monooxygenase n=1 Tax=Fulvivirga maritima TaxID=2904247 RepID=UPI001F435074|nr:lytic polysaccharide monooxygenase [Fulvivirga maritima]UII25836.1 lytic polysaccharide monooxygenase [Fulvivirga maritima]
MKTTTNVFTVILLILVSLPLQYILAHGTVTSPASRVWICYQEDPQSPDSPACIASIEEYGTQAFYDWNEVARMDANGMHRQIIPDGQLASAGRPDKYGGLDQVRDDWIATPVSPGPFTVTWTNTAPHETLYYEVYITKADWTPDQPLTWNSLELLVRTGPRSASAIDNIDVVLPVRTGKHVIYSIWQRSLSAEAFYSTSDVDFGTDTGINLPPVPSFESDNGRCGGSEVDFDASETYDPNGDELTYTWDFGDGTTGSGVIVSHIYSDLDFANVTLTVSDGELSTEVSATINLEEDPDCNANNCTFGAPLDDPLPPIIGTYENVHVLGEGGPNLDNITVFMINWSLVNNGLYQFSFNTNNGIPSWYVDLLPASSQSFNAEEPQITISGSGFDGLDGSYYAIMDGTNFVLVSTDQAHTIYFSNSSDTPSCDDGSSSARSSNSFNDLTKNITTCGNQSSFDLEASGALKYEMYPNPASTSVAIRANKNLIGSVINITDMSGKYVKSLTIQGNTLNEVIDVSDMKKGLYFIKITSPNTATKSLKLLVE